jgi:hypothetical protein
MKLSFLDPLATSSPSEVPLDQAVKALHVLRKDAEGPRVHGPWVGTPALRLREVAGHRRNRAPKRVRSLSVHGEGAKAVGQASPFLGPELLVEPEQFNHQVEMGRPGVLLPRELRFQNADGANAVKGSSPMNAEEQFPKQTQGLPQVAEVLRPEREDDRKAVLHLSGDLLDSGGDGPRSADRALWTKAKFAGAPTEWVSWIGTAFDPECLVELLEEGELSCPGFLRI